MPRSTRSAGAWGRGEARRVLDRDGTMVEEAGYLDRLERMVFFPYTVDAVRLLNRAGFAVIVATNQSGIARELIDDTFVAEAHRHLSDRLAAGGARIDAYYYCRTTQGCHRRTQAHVRLPQAPARDGEASC